MISLYDASVRCDVIGRLLSVALLCVVAVALWSGSADAAYIRRYVTVDAGAVTFTGNSMGLDKTATTTSNNRGTTGSVGALMKNYTTPYSPLVLAHSQVGDHYTDAGTTLNYAKCNSTAVLTIPAGSTVLYAELIWGGNYRTVETNGAVPRQDLTAFINNNITLVAPGGGVNSITNDATTRRTLVSPRYYYMRSADVTSIVQSAGAGSYTVGGIVATSNSYATTDNMGGWTLAVIYHNATLPFRSLSLFLGCEYTDQTTTFVPAQVTGFCVNTVGTIFARVLVTAMEGDTIYGGDQMQFSPDGVTYTSVSGARNNVNNFFAGQICDDTGALCTTGTFGNRNHGVGNPGTAVSGARQGWDITNVDGSGVLAHGQTSAWARGTTNQDAYAIAGIGMQINVGAPAFPSSVMTVDKATTYVGDILTYTCRLDNSTGTADATNVLYTSTPPSGTSFVAGSMTLKQDAGATVPMPSYNPVTGLPCGTVAVGHQDYVTYQVRINTIPLSPALAQYVTNSNWAYDFLPGCSGVPQLHNSMTSNDTTAVLIVRLQPTKTVTFTSPVQAGRDLTWTVTIPNTGSLNSTATTLQDAIPALPTATTYVPNSTTMNGTAVADVGGVMPFVAARAVNSPTRAAGVINAGETATIVFHTTVNAGYIPPTPVVNTANIDPDGAGPAPRQTAIASTNPTTADLSVNVTDGKATLVPGTANSYTITVSNAGPGTITGLYLQTTLPPELLSPTYTPSAGSYNSTDGFWGGLNLTTGGSVTLTMPCTISPQALGTLAVTATIATQPGDTDTNPANNTSTDTDTLTPQTDLGITKTDGVAWVHPGGVVTYTITVKNNGPSDIRNGFVLTDTLPASLQTPVFTESVGSYDKDTGVWAGFMLDPGASITMTLSGTVAAAATGTLVNTVTVTPPNGVTDPTPANNTATDTDAVGWNIGGFIYLDSNGNGIKDGTEAGTGFTMYAKLISAGVAIQAAAADPVTGAYGLIGVSNGSYSIIEDDNATLSDTTPTDPAGWASTSPNTIAVTVASVDLVNKNFGDAGGVSVSGYVYEDANHDQLKESAEAGTGAVLYVKLISAGVVAQTVAADISTGLYTFAAVPAGSYTIIEDNDNLANIVPGDAAGWVSTTANSLSVTVATTAITDLNFGDYHGALVTGHVFNDRGNGTAGSAIANNGVLNSPTESGIAGVTVRLCSSSSCATTYDTDVTVVGGGYGLYVPSTVANGTTLYVMETDLNGYDSTGDSIGGVAQRTTTSTTALRNTLTLSMTSGTTYTDYDFGDVKAMFILTDQSFMAVAGDGITIKHTINVNTPGKVALMLASSHAWNYSVYNDSNCDGSQDGGAVTPVGGYYLLNGGANVGAGAYCVVITITPSSGTPNMTVENMVVMAQENWANSPDTVGSPNPDTGTVYDDTGSYNTDTITINGQTGGMLRLEKWVRNVTTGELFTKVNAAAPCQILEYRIDYKNIGSKPINSVFISDTIPNGTTLLENRYSGSSMDAEVTLNAVTRYGQINEGPDTDGLTFSANLIKLDLLKMFIKTSLAAGEEGYLKYSITVKCQ